MKNKKAKFIKLVKIDINLVIKLLILSDVLIMGSAAMLSPIFALFIDEKIVTNNPELVAGTAISVFLFFKSVLQFPVSRFLDLRRGEKDDYYALVIFSIIMSLTPLLYFFVKYPIQLFVVQALFGIFTTFTYPSYQSIFTKHIDKKEESTEWGVYFTLTDLSSAFFAFIGGVISNYLGFYTLISIVCFISLLGSISLIPLKKYIYLK